MSRDADHDFCVEMRPRLLAFVRRKCPRLSVQIAEEVVQTAFLKHWIFRDANPVVNAPAHLFMVLTWALADEIERQNRERPVGVGVDGHDPLDDIESPPPPFESDPVELSIFLIAEWLRANRPGDVEVFMLRAQGIPYKEIARRLGIQAEAASQRFCRAAEAIRRHISEMGIDEHLEAMREGERR